MKRILHISKYYAPFAGGTEQVARDCVRALDGLFEQKVICFNHEPGDAADEVDGVEVIRAGCFAKVASQSLSASYGRLLARAFREFRPDAVVFHYPNPFVARYLLRQIPEGTKLAVYWHLDIVRQKLLKHLFAGQNRRLVRRADMLIATSPAYVEGSPHLSAAREKCRVVPNCIDPRRLQPTEASEALARELRRENAGRTLCLAVGRHTRYKGFDRLIRASALLDDSFRICIAGAGEETRRLREMAAGDGKIRFLGRVDDDTLKGYMAAADIFCFPSVTRNEAFGVALAEAMYCGKPAVTFTIPGSGVNYVCRDGKEGLEAPNGDVGAYAEALRRLAADPELRRRLGENGRLRVEEEFVYERYRENIRAALDALL